MSLCKDALTWTLTGLLAAPLVTVAADYSRTETITYHDDTAAWVLGQVEAVKLVASSPPLDPAFAYPLEITRTDYGWKNQPIKKYSFGRPVLEIGYNTADGTVSHVTDGAGHITSVGSWKRGIPQTIAYADGTSQSAVVANDGTVTSITDANGFKTSYEYDEMGRVIKTTFPTGDSTAWAAITQSFDQITTTEFGIPAGHWRQSVSSGGFRSYTYFDALWRPILAQQYDAADQAATRTGTVKQYDHEGREVFASYPRATWSNVGSFTEGVITTYDAIGRVREVLQDSELGELSTTTWYGGNSNGPYTKVNHPNGGITRTWFQAFDTPSYDTPTTIWHPEAAYTHIARDAFGKTTRLRRSNSSNATSGSLAVNRDYTYNSYQQLCRVDEPESGTSVMGYDAAGNVAWSAMGYTPTGAGCVTASSVAARRIDRSYDLRNRITAMSFPDSRGNTTHTYTPDGLPASIMVDNGDGNVVTTSYTYNKRRLPTSERMQWDNIDWTIALAYNANGHLSSETLPGSLVLEYAPNALGQPTQAGTYASNASYFPNGALKQFTYANGIVHTLTQNTRGLAERSRDAYGSTAFHDDSYDYDANANLMAISDGLAGGQGNRSMAYDGLNRLTQVHDAPMLGGDGSASFSYNALDNMLSGWVQGVGAVNYTYDTNNRLTNMRNAAGATITGLGYDVQGNVNNRNGGTLDFDFGNRLRAYGSTTYVYDALGRRVRDFTGGSKYSLYSQGGKLVYENDARKQRQRWNIYLGSSMVAVRERNTGDGTVRNLYQHTDGLGSPVVVTDASRNVVEQTRYAPYGEQIGGTAKDGPGYTGHVMDAATGLTYMQQRYYDPKLGSFLSVDPVSAYAKPIGAFNRYRYANGNPYLFTDPDGRDTVQEQIDSGAEGCGRISCAGWAALSAMWQGLGAEGVSQLYDKGWSGAAEGSRADAVLEVGAVVPFVKLGRAGGVVIGRAQRTLFKGAPSGHAFRSLRVAASMLRSGGYERISLNRRISTLTNGEINSRLRPDVAGLRADGKVDVAEVLSPGQNAAELQKKYADALGDRMGEFKAVEPTKVRCTGSNIRTSSC